MVESAALLSLLGVLLAAFTPTFMQQLRVSKIAEATEMLERLHVAAAAYYATPQRGAGQTWLKDCLIASAGPTPSTPTRAPQPVDFDAQAEGRATWRALGLSHAELRYSYQVESPAAGCGPRAQLPYPALHFRAYGDLDGDGEYSVLERSAAVPADRNELVPVGELHIERRIE